MLPRAATSRSRALYALARTTISDCHLVHSVTEQPVVALAHPLFRPFPVHIGLGAGGRCKSRVMKPRGILSGGHHHAVGPLAPGRLVAEQSGGEVLRLRL